MSISEFGLIEKYFIKKIQRGSVNRIGIGDDCALIDVPLGYELVITTDTMVEGVHFFSGADPRLLGQKLLAVNLSDLAAMGAEPTSVTLALTLREVNESWLKEFSEGFLGLANQFSVDLIGGDTTSGALILTVQAVGLVPKGRAMLRSSAQIDDFIFVTGNLGDAGLGFKIEKGNDCFSSDDALKKFHQPFPKINEGLAIRDCANSCIDISDGLASDLKHILKQSGVGAKLDWDKIPLSKGVKRYIDTTGDWQMPLSAGEDYELCFTVSPDKVDSIDIDCTHVGVIEAKAGLRIQRLGKTEELVVKGFEHFS
ncbi:MAG: thiamine-phosphate kinase [Methylococcales bacterium]|nr:thiamine-phosphate kinase [Methylococcales bacterium]